MASGNAGQLPFIVRVLKPFTSQLDGEISLVTGELALVTQIEDRHWFYGQIADRAGRFPRNNVTAPIDLPAATEGQVYFVTLATFTPQQFGDLYFKQGEVLVGLDQVDENWWYGRSADGREGIFPTSLTWKANLLSSFIKHKPAGEESRIPFVRKRARVTQNLVAQLPNELNLRKGEEVVVTGLTEDEWYIGECNGQSGIFPPGFVTLLDDNTPSSTPLLLEPILPSFSAPLNSNKAHGVVCYDFHAQHSDELDLREGETVYLLKYVNAEWIQGEDSRGRIGIFPAAFIRVVVDCRPEIDQLLFDFDTLCDSTLIFPSETNQNVETVKEDVEIRNRWSGNSGNGSRSEKTTSLEDVIARNLIQLGSSSVTQAGRKERPPSWTQALTQLQVEHSILPIEPKPIEQKPPPVTIEKQQLPTVPPRQQRNTVPVNKKEIKKQHSSPILPINENVPEQYSPLEERNEAPLIIEEPKRINKESYSIGARGSSSRKSYTRPAPPPPVEAPNRGVVPMSRSLSTTQAQKPIRPVPINRSVSLEPSLQGGDSRVEGRRKRVEKDKQRKMEEDRMRDLEMKKKVKEQRENVITELLVTEREYCRDLRLTCQVFELHDTQSLEKKGIDASILFGNLLEVIKLSEKIIDELNQCNREEASSDDQSIANCFIRNEPEFRRIYGQYCTTHEDAQTLLEKYEAMPNVNRILEEAVLTLRQQIICFNMGSVIIKPVQRIMKYPLILGELIKCTENGHPDKDRLMIAAGLMTAVAAYINESKRKKEIVLKYRDSKVDSKIGKFNMHSVAKKTSRIGMMVKASLGMAPTSLRDEAFDEIGHRFNELVRVIQTALKDIVSVCEQLKATSQTQYNISEAVASFYGEGNRAPLVDNFRTAQRMIFAHHWSSFDSYVIQHVRNPLTALCEACLGPERLVQKRVDKLLDCNIASERLAKNKDPGLKRTLEEEANLARNTYAALNGQLMEELPIITQHGFNIYRRCLSSFLHARKLLVGRVTKSLLDLNEMPDIANLQGQIDEDFNVAYGRAVERLSRVTFINRSFRSSRVVSTNFGDGSFSSSNETTPPRKSSTVMGSPNANEGGMVVQSREIVHLLRSKYHPEQLYMVTNRCEIKDPLDLAANSGLIVSVIKREDPMGNTGRWFVDAGEVRGFLPSRYLGQIPLQPSSSSHLLRPESAVSLASSGGASGTSTSLDSFKDAQLTVEEPGASFTNSTDRKMPAPEDHTYDLPPTYEEAQQSSQQIQSPHRYYEIPDDNHENNSAGREGSEKAESPIYADIEDVLPSKSDEEKPPPAENNVYKVDYTFKKRTPLEIDLNEGELVTVMAKHDEAGNEEWWLVENDAGAHGYAPAAYLSQLLVAENRSSPQLFC